MPSAKDKRGRPIVVVTGLGVVTSLGAGKTDNWAKLTAGESGIRAITRFPDRRPEDAHRRHHRLSAGRSRCHRRPVRASRRARRRGGDRPIRHRRRTAIFPGRCSWRCRRSRSNGRSGIEIAASIRRQRQRSSYDDLLRACAAVSRLSRALPVRLGRRSSRRQIRHQGLADFAVDRLRLGRERDPARRRGDPPRRNRRRALHRHRRLDQPGSADPLLAAVGAVDQQRSAARRGQALLPRTATAS